MGAPVKGLGLILNQPTVPTIALAIGVPTVALGAMGMWHTFGSMHLVKSAWGKTGLFIGGLLSLLVGLDGASLTAMGLMQLLNPSLLPSGPTSGSGSGVPSNVAGIRRLRGIGRLGAAAQPDVLVGQDHWLDRQWPDRYAEWWTEPGPRI
jgi:hypothetical protein